MKTPVHSFFKFLEEKKDKLPPLLFTIKYDPENLVKPGGRVPPLDTVRMYRYLTDEQIEGVAKALDREEKIVIEGNLTIGVTPILDKVFLEKPVNVEGSLSVLKVKSFPKNIKVLGNINLYDIQTRGSSFLPKDYTVEKNLKVSGCYFDSLSENLHIKESLTLSRMELFRYLPKGLKIEGDLILEQIGFQTYFKGMKAAEKLEFVRTVLAERGGYLKGNLISRN